jgi:hypothetical protein
MKRASLGILAVVLSAVLAPAVAGQAGVKGTPAGKAAGKTPVESFLGAVRDARGAAEVLRLLEQSRLTPGEEAQIARELSKPEWAAKLSLLAASAPGAAKGRAATPIQARKSVSSPEQVQRVRVAAANQAVAARLATVRARSTVAPARHSATVSGGVSGQMLSVRPAGPEWPSTIERIESEPVAPGQVITIRGRGFGDQPGSISILLDGLLYDCPAAQSWRDTQVRVQVPFELLPWSTMADVPPDVRAREPGRFGQVTLTGGPFDSGRMPEVWVRLSDGRWGGGRPFELRPDLGQLTPAITAVTPAELTPGAEVLIEGTNFGNERDHGGSRVSLSLVFGGVETPLLRIMEWHNAYILAQLPDDLTRMLPMTGGRMTIRNRLGLETVHGGLSFRPAEEVAELRAGPYHARCHPTAVPPLCWFGETRRVTPFDLTLNEGWTVEDSWIEIMEQWGASSGAYWDSEPVVGSQRLVARLVVWADGLSWVKVRPHVTVRGPRGTSPR